MPQRIQRRRTAGWRMPEGAVYVGRGSKWGNPFVVTPIGSGPYCWTVVDNNAVDYREPPEGWLDKRSAALKAVNLFLMDIKGQLAPYPPLSDLRGKDLACWCPLDSPCHADVLLELANDPPSNGAVNV
ncbi:DUF4326 domain-containing protein [Mycobacteroides abscessus]|uniref:DUF4326 domain-containing protein n=1 Tax=Mycobacteroides abscessus TaxID=36809 RepID=UPI000E67AC8D|nr:DUF4326 domain-containing protein [Mycobacteroides abscessus]RIS73985.1 DUF4326 domain-containing protein [Mycobacteroides abscessus]